MSETEGGKKRSHCRDPLSAYQGSSPSRQTEAVPRDRTHRHPRHRADRSQGPGQDRLEADHRPDLRSREEAIEKLRWYGLRWKIETFHKILKSGCKAEEARLRAAERIVNLLAILCPLRWRIFCVPMLNRAIPQ